MSIIEVITSPSVLAGGVLSLAGTATWGLIRRRRREKEAARDWYDEACGQLENVEQVARRATDYRPGPDRQFLSKELPPLDQEMMRQANRARKRVDEASRLELAVIAAYATGLASLAGVSREQDTLDFMKRVQQEAIESYEGEYSMADFETMFSSFDFGEFTDQIDPDIELDDEAASELREYFSEDSIDAGRPLTMQEALTMPIEKVEEAFENDTALRGVVDDAFEGFLDMVVELARDTRHRMRERQREV